MRKYHSRETLFCGVSLHFSEYWCNYWNPTVKQINIRYCRFTLLYVFNSFDRFSHLLRCEVALHFINTWDINDLTFNNYLKERLTDVKFVSRVCSRFRQIEIFCHGFLSSDGLLRLFQTSILHLECYFAVHNTNKTCGFKKWVCLGVLFCFLTVGCVKLYFVTELHARSETCINQNFVLCTVSHESHIESWFILSQDGQGTFMIAYMTLCTWQDEVSFSLFT